MTCISDVAAAIKGLIDPKDADTLLKDIAERTEARMVRNAMPRAEALGISVEEVIAEREAKLQRAQVNSARNIIKRKEAQEQIKLFPQFSKGLYAYFGGVESNIAKSRQSVVADILAEELNRKNQFITDLEQEKGAKKYFDDRKNSDTIIKEIENPGSTGDKLASQVANMWKKHLGWLTRDLNKEGAFIGELEEYVAKTMHNTARMLEATESVAKDIALRTKLLLENKGDYAKVAEQFKEQAYQRWFNTVRPMVDDSRTLETVLPENEGKFFRSFYDATTTGIHKVPYSDSGHPLITRAGSNLAEKLSQEKVLYLKSGQWGEYNKIFGYGNFQDAAISQLENGSKSLSLMRKLGTSPRIAAERLIRWAEENGRKEPNAVKHVKNTRNLLDTIMGDSDRQMQGLGGSIIRAFRMWTYITHLGGIVPSSIPDLGIMASAAKANGIKYLDSYGSMMSELFKGMGEGDRMRLARDIGTFSDGAMGSLFTKYGSEDSLHGRMTSMMRVQDKLSGINYWDSVHRNTMGFMLSKNLAENAGKDFASLDKGLQRTLNISGIGDKEWNLIRKYTDGFVDVNNTKFLAPSVINSIEDSTISKELLGKANANPLAIEKARFDLKRSLEIYFTDQASYGKVFPNMSDMSLVKMGSKADTYPGMLWRYLTMFKSFHVASTRRTLGRFIYGGGADNMYEAFIGGKGDLKGMVNYMVQTLPFGYLSTAAKALAVGYALPNIGDPKTWLNSMTHGGTFFAYGNFFLDAINSSKDVLGAAAGPGLSTISQAMTLITRLGMKEYKEHSEGLPQDYTSNKSSAIDFTRQNIPFVNIFYLKALVDHTFMNSIHTMVDPMYPYKLEQKAEKRGTPYLWKPSQSLGVQ